MGHIQLRCDSGGSSGTCKSAHGSKLQTRLQVWCTHKKYSGLQRIARCYQQIDSLHITTKGKDHHDWAPYQTLLTLAFYVTSVEGTRSQLLNCVSSSEGLNSGRLVFASSIMHFAHLVPGKHASPERRNEVARIVREKVSQTRYLPTEPNYPIWSCAHFHDRCILYFNIRLLKKATIC